MLAASVETLPQLFLKRIETTPHREAYREKWSDRWTGTPWRAFGDRVLDLAAGMHASGIAHGDTVAIIGGCRPEWGLIDMAALLIGCRTVGIYETLLVDQARYILEDSGAKTLFVQGAEQFARLRTLRDSVERLETLVTWGYSPEGELDGVTTLDALLATGATRNREAPGHVQELAKAVRPEDTAIVVYTSGTTGQPKGVPLGHGLIVKWLAVTGDMLMEEITDDDVTIAFLPYAHVAEHVPGFFGRMNIGLAAAYATSYETLLDELQEVRPTYFGAVPRIFEKMYGRIRERVAQANPRRQKIFAWARDLARRNARAELEGEPLSLRDRLLLPVADRFVYRRIREVFGGRVKVFLTGSAPIELEILEFFYGCGMKIHEVYGLSESCAIAFANGQGATRLGTVGKAIPGLEVKLADDGEILLRGPSIFPGYLDLPSANADAFDADGFFRTGDIGTIDREGFLTITDRKKNLLKTAGGKYVVPARLEMLVKEEPIVGQVYVHGDRKPFVVALITLDEREVDALAAELGCPPESLAEHPDVQRRIGAAVERANSKLARFEQIKKHRILARDFSLEDDTVTPTLKIKRKNVAALYANDIEALYSQATAHHAHTATASS